MPLTAASEMVLSTVFAASLTVSAADFWKRAVVLKRRALRMMVERNIVAVIVCGLRVEEVFWV